MPRLKRTLRIGLVVEGRSDFFAPVESELRKRYRVDRFAPRFVRLPLIGSRVNDHLLDLQLLRFLVSHDVTFFEWAGSLLIRATHLPKRGRIVTRLHSIELATAADKIVWPKVDSIILVSEHIRTRLEAMVRASLPIVVVANGVDLNEFVPVRRSFEYRIGMVCSLLPVKRIYETVLSVYQLRQDGYPFTLRIAGQPQGGEPLRYLWALESLVTRLSLSDAVQFHGHVSNVADWLRHIDIFVSNSYWEGQQIALLEAMAAGCYCLGHCWEGVEEVLPRGNIFVTDAELRAKLLAYAALPERERREAQNTLRAIAESKFDAHRMVSDVISTIEGVARQ